MEEAPVGVTSRTKHPKWGQVPSYFPFFLFFSPDSDGSSSEGKTYIQIVPSHFCDFLFTAGQGLGVIFPLLHSACEEENALQILKAQGRVVLPPLTFLDL